VKISRIEWDGSDPGALAARLRALQPQLSQVSGDVAAIIGEVEKGGDAALMALEKRLGGVEPVALRVPDEELDAAPSAVEPSLVEAMEVAAENIEAVAQLDRRPAARVSNSNVSIALRDVPVDSAAVYAPGGRGAYPSTVLMCCVPARVAGVACLIVASPPGEDGRVNPAVLAAASIADADEVYALGGAQAIAALALGTETVKKVDVIAGPGNRYVQEAKRQLVGRVGIDGIAGPSELMVIADGSVEPRLLALDLCAQAEHGDDGLLVLAAEAPLLDELEALIGEVAAERGSVADAPLALVSSPSPEAAVELADELAPEHLQLACRYAEELSAAVQFAGCVFVGRDGATAFGDYAAGSNHVLPTGGAGRFQGPLGPSTFRRRLATVQVTEEGARELGPVVATLADSEGFPVHGESAMARSKDSTAGTQT
jgi:histidinol dehydrogenase